MKYGLTSKMEIRLLAMIDIINENPFLKKDQLVSKIQDRIQEAIQPNTIRRLLELGGYRKTKIQYDFKKRNTEVIVMQRFKYCKDYKKRLDIYDIYFMNLSEYKFH